MSAVTFRSFIDTHPDLWERIGVAWHHAADDSEHMTVYKTMRETVCLVGRFTFEEFDDEATREFDR